MKQLNFLRKIIFMILIFSPFIIIGQSINARLDNYVADFFKNNVIPGISVAVVKDGKVQYLKAFGVQRTGYPQPMTVYTLNGLGSGTKSMTALAVMQLVERGLIDLDTPVIKYLPKFRTSNEEMSKKITMRMLLSNASGIQGSDKKYFKRFKSVLEGLEETAASLVTTKINREPGTSFEYSNIGFAIAGLVISKVSGLSYEEYMEKNVFTPMGMKTTTTAPDKLDKITANFGNTFGMNGAYPIKKPLLMGGGIEPSGVVLRTSAFDLGNYLSTLLNGGEINNRRIISPENVIELWKPQVSMPAELSKEMGGQAVEANYCLGWFREKIDGRTIIYHSGFTMTFSSHMAIDPQYKTAVAILANLGDPNPFKYRTLKNAANNLLHILANEDFSQYGIPTIEDPTINNYTLTIEQKKKYVGTYMISSEISGHSTYQYSIYLDEKNNLIGENFSNQSIGRFLIDFRSASTTRSRWIGTEFDINFDISLKGTVTGLSIYGAYYNKTKIDRPGFKVQQWPKRGLSFLLCSDWTIDWKTDSDSFSAYNNLADKQTIMSGFVNSSLSSLDAIVASVFPGESLKKAVKLPSELIAGRYCTQIFGSFPDAKTGTLQRMLIYSYIGNEIFYIILSVPEGKLTIAARDVVRPLLISLKHNRVKK